MLSSCTKDGHTDLHVEKQDSVSGTTCQTHQVTQHQYNSIASNVYTLGGPYKCVIILTHTHTHTHTQTHTHKVLSV